MTIIIDSNFLFALKFEKDKNSDRAIEILNELVENYEGLMLTNYLVINEAITLIISRTKANPHYFQKMSDLIWGEQNFFDIYLLSPNEYKSVNDILKKYCTPKRLLSYIDASLIFLHKQYKADYILSFDNHFDNLLKRMY